MHRWTSHFCKRLHEIIKTVMISVCGDFALSFFPFPMYFYIIFLLNAVKSKIVLGLPRHAKQVGTHKLANTNDAFMIYICNSGISLIIPL